MLRTLALEDVAIVATTDAVLKVRLGHVLVDIVRYPYALLQKPKAGPEGFPVASIIDLASMKLAAIAMRGIYRDFWDLHEIITRTRLTLAKALDGYTERFGVKKADVYHVLRALTYFDDAKREPRPRGLTVAHWREIKAHFIEAAPRALARRVASSR